MSIQADAKIDLSRRPCSLEAAGPDLGLVIDPINRLGGYFEGMVRINRHHGCWRLTIHRPAQDQPELTCPS
jgi:hypothetical protein